MDLRRGNESSMVLHSVMATRLSSRSWPRRRKRLAIASPVFLALLEGGVRAPVDENGIWLVRPDGYVAVASRAGDWAAVDEYLSSMKSPPHAGLR